MSPDKLFIHLIILLLLLLPINQAQNNKDNLGKPINEPEIDTSKTADPDSPGTPDLKGGEI